MRDLPGRMFPERAAECYKNHRPNVTRISGREFPESLAECYKNGWPNLVRISSYSLGIDNICLLGRFIAAAEKNYNFLAGVLVVNPIARAVVVANEVGAALSEHPSPIGSTSPGFPSLSRLTLTIIRALAWQSRSFLSHLM